MKITGEKERMADARLTPTQRQERLEVLTQSAIDQANLSAARSAQLSSLKTSRLEANAKIVESCFSVPGDPLAGIDMAELANYRDLLRRIGILELEIITQQESKP